jgi:hypothetical protein
MDCLHKAQGSPHLHQRSQKASRYQNLLQATRKPALRLLNWGQGGLTSAENKRCAERISQGCVRAAPVFMNLMRNAVWRLNLFCVRRLHAL